MRRWLIALFACHFLLGVVGFGISDHIVDLPREAAALHANAAGQAPGSAGPMATHGQGLQQTQKGLSDLAHALADELPDLPDSLQRRAVVLLSHVMTPTQPHATVAQLPRPALDSPFRPPRLG